MSNEAEADNEEQNHIFQRTDHNLTSTRPNPVATAMFWLPAKGSENASCPARSNSATLSPEKPEICASLTR